MFVDITAHQDIKGTIDQVFVYRYNMNTLAGKCIQICRKCCHKRFSFTCFHFTYAASVKNDTAYYLYTEMLHPKNTP